MGDRGRNVNDVGGTLSHVLIDGSVLGSKLRRYCNGTRFRYAFR